MKRPRRPTKKMRKAGPFKWTAKCSKALIIGRGEDPFHVDPLSVPDRVALMWTDDLDRTYATGGWRSVPGQKSVQGMTLVWAPAETAKAQLAELKKLAVAMRDHGHEIIGRKLDRNGRPFALVSPIMNREYATLPADAAPIDVQITIDFQVPVSWQSAALVLDLSAQEYARRRLIMEETVLGPVGGYYPGSSYAPIELSFTRKN